MLLKEIVIYYFPTYAQTNKQTKVEDHAAAEQRKNKQGIRAKGEEVIQRKVTQILTCGTVADEALLSDYRTAYLLCLGYIEGGDLGVCLLDSAMRTFQIGAIPTDGDCAALKALLLKFSPREVLYERGRLPAVAAALLRNHDAPITVLPSFVSAQEGFAVFGRCQAQPPPLLRNASPQVLSAFGGVVSYLERLHTLDETIKGANFVSLTEVRSGGSVGRICFPSSHATTTRAAQRQRGVHRWGDVPAPRSV